MRLLHINASPRGADSRTLQISNTYLSALKENNPALFVDELDLDGMDLPDMGKKSAEAKYMAMGGMAVQDNGESHWDGITELGKKFVSYDQYLISTPMWNFSVPYKLKHYIDVIMQPGITFRFSETGVEGLVLGKKMVCVTTRGSDYSAEGPMGAYDFQEPYLRSIFGLAGIYDVNFINAQPLDYTPELTQMVLEKAKELAKELAQAASAAVGL
ncbi:MAG: NAD(P)H-dependent oxidoreductase [Saprospiraceae bacterium]